MRKKEIIRRLESLEARLNDETKIERWDGQYGRQEISVKDAVSQLIDLLDLDIELVIGQPTHSKLKKKDDVWTTY